MRRGGGHGTAGWLIGLAVMAVAVVGAATFLLVGKPIDSPQQVEEPEVVPNDVIAARFPAEWEGAVPLTVAAFALATMQKPEILANATTLDWLTASPLVFDQARLGLASLPPYMTPQADLPEGPDVVIPQPRPAQKVTLFTDGQIASIKQRLKLSPDQEEMWPQVEAALRAITWRGSAERLSHRSASLDPKSLQKISAVLGPFVKKLRDEQKDELRSIAHVMGLERLASEL